MQTAASNAVMANSLQQAGKAMNAVGTAVDPEKLQKDMKQFGKQSEIQSMQQSMLDEALDAAFDTDDIGEESNLIYQQVLEEVGAELASKMVDTPLSAVTARRQENSEKNETESDLAEKLEALRAA
jgi:hypothetical protein